MLRAGVGCRLFCRRLRRRGGEVVVKERVERRRREGIEMVGAQVVLFSGVWLLEVRGVWVVDVDVW